LNSANIADIVSIKRNHKNRRQTPVYQGEKS